VVSDGAGDVVVVSCEGRWTIQPPAIRAVNSNGSGDLMLAGIARRAFRG